MELRQIEHFLAVAGELSFTRAAERAHVVQSALSTSVAKLERELGVQLFDRSRQQITLTTAGERFRTHAFDVLRATRAATESVGEFRGTLSGTVEFGSLISFGPLDVPGALGEFHRAHPHVRLRLRLSQSGASAYLAALTEGSLDLALVSMPNRFPAQLDLHPLFEEPMTFVCRTDHPLATSTRLDIADVATEELVGFPPDFGLRKLVDDAFHAAGVHARTRYEVPAGFAAIAELVSNGLGTTFMPRCEARRFPNLRAVDLVNPVSWQVYLASPPVEQMTPSTARLADTLLAAAARAR
ncbi:LysR family transcriptional regulator [Mycolicibacterium canariasense]|uniref:Probable hydrogen peroxide-inducible genes activator n=1 Tax=Mycolicibacterium canariasense TaxID=228230 RepID=A0A124E2C7_MYCCR|nr:LysR family transcriptional regulator [Mycolicibacterium canariasense]MCV7209929.1 LysR family transcriptional regulator [Mycolicibacterium canariasense]ORV05199.1 LysR family transcriptional regulator [Mycolicibacterium canariasense]GAS96390.1 LysR family transcriptional regulator [Mycolicibacterium canariasense]